MTDTMKSFINNEKMINKFYRLNILNQEPEEVNKIEIVNI